MVNPLEAGSIDTASPFSGAYLIEDGQALVDAIQSGNWVAGGMAAFSGVLDTAAAIIDPIGTLIANGLGWVLDHVEPLKGWMNDFTGDAGEVAGFAQTWRNVGTRMHDTADSFARRTHDLDGMSGATVDAYLTFAGDAIKHFHATGDWANTIATGMEMASQLVQIIHDLIRDALSQIVGTAISVATEMLLSFGLATPAAISQIGTKVASLANRISRTITRLLTSLKNLHTLLDQLTTLFTKASRTIKNMLHGNGSGGEALPASPSMPSPGELLHTGGETIPRNALDGGGEWAEDAYERFRSDSSDLISIAGHPQNFSLPNRQTLTIDELQRIKQHVFFDEHLVSDYDGGLMRQRYDANPYMAEAWYRLMRGEGTETDRFLLLHELAESDYLRSHPGATYREAHDAANQIADWESKRRRNDG